MGRYDLFKQKHTIAGGIVLAGLAWIYASGTLWDQAVWALCAFVTGAVVAHYLYFVYLIVMFVVFPGPSRY